jgi:hypothetical protein
LDINTITEVVRQPLDPPGAGWRAGDAFLAGGTWLFSDQQPDLRRLIDLMPLGWDTLRASDAGLERFDDPNGSPDHRRHLAGHYAEEIRAEFTSGGLS